MANIESIKFTTSDYIEVYAPDGSYISRHRVLDEARESALQHAIAHAQEGESEYTFRSPDTRMSVIVAAPAGNAQPGVDVDPPLAPAGVGLANQQATSIQVNWASNSEPDLADYRIYRSTTSETTGFSVVGTVATPGVSFVDVNFLEGTRTWYKVTARDSAGNESEFSNTVVSTVVNQGTGTGAAIDFSFTCIENRSQWVCLAGISDDLTYNQHTFADAPNINWSTRYTQWYVAGTTPVGGVAFTEWKIITVPTFGTLYDNTGTAVTAGDTFTDPDGFLYVPNADSTGTDTFTYDALDSTGRTDSATVTMNVVAAASYTTPLGIPAAPFGVSDEPPSDPANWPSAEQVGWYYVDADHPSATDSGNTYGYPDQPRASLPGSGATIAAGGKVVIKAATNPYQLRNNSWHSMVFSGTQESERAWIVGVNDGPNKPIITGDPSRNGEQLRLINDYYTFDGIIFDDVVFLQRTDGNGGIGNCVRHCEFRNTATISGAGVNMGSASDGVIFSCYVHNIGLIESDLGTERDVHGVISGSKNDMWYLDSLSHHCAGDTFQAGNNNNSSNLYIGRVKGHSDGENHADIKDHNRIVISECDGWDYRTIQYGNSGGGAQIFYINDEGTQTNGAYILNCRAWDTNGTCFGSANIGATSPAVFINCVGFRSEGGGFTSFGGAGPRSVFFSTFYDVQNGLSLFLSGQTGREFAGNIVVPSAGGTAVDYTGGGGFNADLLDYNVFGNDLGTPNYDWQGSSGGFSAYTAANGSYDQNSTEENSGLSNAPTSFVPIPSSPAVDSITPAEYANFTELASALSALSISIEDILGTSRPQNTNYDAGAYER